MKIKDIENVFKNCAENRITFSDGVELIVYTGVPLTALEIGFLSGYTSKVFKHLIKNSKNFTTHRVDDLPDGYKGRKTT